jgi:RNA polymerase sigma-B factor
MTEQPRTAAPPLLPRQTGRRRRADQSPAATAARRAATRPRADADALASLPLDDPRRPAARDRIVEQHLPLVRVLAARYRHLGEPLDDLVQVGTIGLIQAVDRFDPRRGVPLPGYASSIILGEIRRHLRDRSATVRIPRQVQEVQGRVADAVAELTQRLRRSPTLAEISRECGVGLDLVVETLEARRASATVPIDTTTGDGRMLGDGETSRSPDLTDPALVQDETALDDVLHREALRPVLARLDERQKRILALRFFRGLSQREIAAEIGVSQMHVSRLLAQTLGRIRAEVDGEPRD